jgi:adenylosuccinate synthase
MPILICVGVQWGDEGKGKVVDYLTESAQLVVRFQGGSNAGHTLVVEGQKTALRLIPSGILRRTSRCLLAAGVVIDPEVLLSEIEALEKIGVKVTPERLGIAGEASIVLPYHQALDREKENSLGDSSLGTTKKGIGPAYEDLVARSGIRFSDLRDLDSLSQLIERNVQFNNKVLREVYGSSEQFDAKVIMQSLKTYADKLVPHLANVSLEVHNARKSNALVIFEGAQGSLLDIYHGTYPYVTSSSTLAGFACVSAGFAPSHVDYVLGVCKAYATRVGSGPFPTEDLGSTGERMREVGQEYGTVTKRPRRCGWFDAVAATRTVRLNGVDGLLVTKLDVLSGFEKILIGTGYELDGETLEDLPCGSGSEKVKVTYIELPGWSTDISNVRSLNDLPKEAAALLETIAQVTGCKVCGFSVGPDREQTILTSPELDRLLATATL